MLDKNEKVFCDKNISEDFLAESIPRIKGRPNINMDELK
jgi:hypothetical protein